MKKKKSVGGKLRKTLQSGQAGSCVKSGREKGCQEKRVVVLYGVNHVTGVTPWWVIKAQQLNVL